MRLFVRRDGATVFVILMTVTTMITWASVGSAQTAWEKYPHNPVLEMGPIGTWDDVGVFQPGVLFDGMEYRMWYSGDNGSNTRIGVATSPDGIAWTKHVANPVIQLGGSGAWDDFKLFDAHVLFDGTEYRMWFGGHDGTRARIGTATSLDGIVWVKYEGNPVLDVGPDGSWDDVEVRHPSVFFDGMEYRMWYRGDDGSNFRIGYATSPDGIVWTRDAGNPHLDVGPSGAWDDRHVNTPEVLFDGTEYVQWYTGRSRQVTKIGYATSPDGIAWMKSPDNPVLEPGPGGSWDDYGVLEPSVLSTGAGREMWFSGYHHDFTRTIGYAVSLTDCPDSDGDGSMDRGCGGWDCDDSDPDIHPGMGVYPGAVELCDGLDTDCDGSVPEEESDADGDGWRGCEGDCDDSDPDVSPDATEGTFDDPTCYDGLDNDCDGLTDMDPECMAILVPHDYSTIQAAIEAAVDGNTIRVSPGTYREILRFKGKDLKIRSLGGPLKTILDGGQSGSVVTFSRGETEEAVLDGFTITNGRGKYLTDSDFGFKYYAGGGIYCRGSAPTIENCKIERNFAYLGGGVYLREADATFTNTIIAKNWAVGGVHGGGGLYLETSSPTIAHCTIGANVANYYGGGIFCWDASPRITNSILWNNHSIFDREIHVRSGVPAVRYSNVKDGWPGAGNIHAGPLFVDWHDFHLKLGSPCIDAGTDAGVVGDIDGQARPHHGGFDMGVDEFATMDIMVTIPAGEFVMGSDPGEGASQEMPEHVVNLSAYEIDLYEVTNKEFAEFMNAYGSNISPEGYAILHTESQDQHISWDDSSSSWELEDEYELHPVIEVTWFGAKTFCEYYGKRLPTEAEWEKAARGGCEKEGISEVCEDPYDERLYPWGDEDPTCDIVNYNHEGEAGTDSYCVGDTTRVGSYSSGVSPYRIDDMAGNVWEWVYDGYRDDYYEDSPYQDPQGPTTFGLSRVLRGGAWKGTWYDQRVTRRNAKNADRSAPGLGFRCAR